MVEIQTHSKYYSFLCCSQILEASLPIWVYCWPKIHQAHILHMYHFPKHTAHYLLHTELRCESLLQILKRFFYELLLTLIQDSHYLHNCHDHIDPCCRLLHLLPMSILYPVNPKLLNENLHNQYELCSFLTDPILFLAHYFRPMHSFLLPFCVKFHPRHILNHLTSDKVYDNLHKLLALLSYLQTY